MSKYIEIHGQNQNQQLFDSSTHIKYLDNFIGEELLPLKSEYSSKFIRYNEVKREIRNNYGDEKEKQRKLDLLKYQLNEIQEAKLKKDEEEKLEEKRKIMLNSEKIAKNLSEASQAVGENTIDVINNFFQRTQYKKMGKIRAKGNSAVLDPVRYNTKKLNNATIK